ncbi:XkdX family protein [Clostridioides sp. ZZV14-6154]|nr:XkdX family protein [Clostridioides sp. ZZV14-6150]MCC0659081.1 XkdX family protein [Clostridioides sp. ZZV14-6154]MCC0740393.1 XkdX family protein [Clostridioides sp. ZZV14-5902]MCC0744414.1 XkdX family protein [Clostridioides sp. ZZV14-6044]MCC0752462.1 XkdX family protein [Clostridioides sp. ZZV13-5731]
MLGYEKIKYYYDNKMWTKEMVKNSVDKNKITATEYKEIVGEDYIA